MRHSFHLLIVFCLLLCSCKTRKVATDYNENTKVNSDVSVYHEEAKIDTTRTTYSDVLNQVTTIEETIKVTEYDAESGKPIKETETKRKITQDTNQVVAKDEQKGESVVTNDSISSKVESQTDIDSTTEEESIGGQESFGKWLGIIIGMGIVVGIVILIAYLRKKLRVSNCLK